MSIKQINEMYERLKNSQNGEAIADPSFSNKIIDLISELNNHSEVSKNVVLSVMSEEEFVHLMLMVQKMVVAAMAMNGEFSIMQADLDRSLQEYTHTVVLSVIGLLISEEIL